MIELIFPLWMYVPCTLVWPVPQLKRTSLAQCMAEKKVVGKFDGQMLWEEMNEKQKGATLRALVCRPIPFVIAFAIVHPRSVVFRSSTGAVGVLPAYTRL